MERKRYTLGLMQEFRSSRVYHEQRLNILRHFPNPTVPMTYNQLKQEYRALRDEQPLVPPERHVPAPVQEDRDGQDHQHRESGVPRPLAENCRPDP